MRTKGINMEMDKTINNREDTRKLINYVRYESEIYTNTRLNKRTRSDCWNAIATKFDGKYSRAECRRKWKSLKDSYKKFLKQRNNGRRSEWIYAPDLEFIYKLSINEMSKVAQRKVKGFKQLHKEKVTMVNECTDLNNFSDFSEFGINSVCDTNHTITDAVSIDHDTDVRLPSELDNFFDYLKNRVQSLPNEKISEAQIQLMACLINVEQNFEPRNQYFDID